MLTEAVVDACSRYDSQSPLDSHLDVHAWDEALCTAEQQLNSQEDRLSSELQSLAENRASLQRTLDQLKGNIDRLIEQDSGSPLKASKDALEELSLPALQLPPEWSMASTVRKQALEARTIAHAALQAMMHAEQARQEQWRQWHALQVKKLRDSEASLLQAKASRPTPQQAKHAEPLRRDGLEKRIHDRVELKAAVNLASEDNFFTGFSLNISEGGLFVATVMQPPAGSFVELNVELPDGSSLRAAGVVRWVREWNDMTPEIQPGVGVQFTDLAPNALAIIQNFVTQREPLFYED